jgi:hypothetical protein
MPKPFDIEVLAETGFSRREKKKQTTLYNALF